MVFGWKPKDIERGGPVPLDFSLRTCPIRRIGSDHRHAPVIYHGPRPLDSLILHKKYSSETSYPFYLNERLISAYEYMSA